jgi:hypothetical protein
MCVIAGWFARSVANSEMFATDVNYFCLKCPRSGTWFEPEKR